MMRIYLPNLADHDVELVRFALMVNLTRQRKGCPIFSFWLMDVLKREADRRISPVPIEVEVPQMPTRDWSNEELRDAQNVAMLTTYLDNVSEVCGDFLDQLVIEINQAIGDRLEAIR